MPQIFTAMPPLAMGIFERCCQKETMLKYPELYRTSQEAQGFNAKVSIRGNVEVKWTSWP